MSTKQAKKIRRSTAKKAKPKRVQNPWPAQKIEQRKVANLVPYARNARTHDAAQVSQIAASIKEWGWTNPILIDEDGGIIAGHGRLLAAQQIGIADVPCMVARGWTKAQKQAYVIADNQLALNAGWDLDILKMELGEIRGLDFDLDLVGFDEKNLGSLLGNGEVVEDEPPPVPEKAKSKLGQLWALGDHRVLCGDATAPSDVEMLMSAVRAGLCLTDPPYSVNYDVSHKMRGGNVDAHAPYQESGRDPTDTLAFMGIVPSNVMVWTFPIDRHFQKLAQAYRDHGWEMRRELVWVKNVFSFWPGAKYQQKHEPIMVATRLGKPIGGHVPANATTTLEHEKPHAHKDHPTARPMALWADLMKNHTVVGDTVYDPFLGSGTTLIACEQLGRRCYGIEIEPKYVDVIITRWENFTGRKAKLVR